MAIITVPQCDAFGCAEPRQAIFGRSAYCAVHTRVLYDFVRWLHGRHTRPDLPDARNAYLSFDAARLDWSSGHCNLVPADIEKLRPGT